MCTVILAPLKGGCLINVHSVAHKNTSYCLKAGGGTLPYTVPLAEFFVYHSLFVIVTRCLSLELLTITTKHLSLLTFSHIIHIWMILKLHPDSKCLSIMILILQYCNIYSKIFVNLHLLLTSPAEVIADIFYVSFSSVSPFPVVKRSGRPARGKTIDLDTVTLLPSKPSCAQSFWHPLKGGCLIKTLTLLTLAFRRFPYQFLVKGAPHKERRTNR